MELLDRLNPTIAQLTEAVEQEVEKCPEAQRLMTHPGVGPLTALAFVLVIGTAERFGCGKQTLPVPAGLWKLNGSLILSPQESPGSVI